MDAPRRSCVWLGPEEMSAPIAPVQPTTFFTERTLVDDGRCWVGPPF
jgi:hypothetical protein